MPDPHYLRYHIHSSGESRQQCAVPAARPGRPGARRSWISCFLANTGSFPVPRTSGLFSKGGPFSRPMRRPLALHRGAFEAASHRLRRRVVPHAMPQVPRLFCCPVPYITWCCIRRSLATGTTCTCTQRASIFLDCASRHRTSVHFPIHPRSPHL